MHVLVEGRDDKELFNAVIKPILLEQYDHVDIWEYAGKTLEKRRKYVTSIHAMGADYLFVADINDGPCITGRKDHLIDRHGGMLDPDRTIIAVKEIESWYVAGVDNQACQELGIAGLPHTDDVTKEQFRGLVPGRFRDSVVDFMTELLNVFQVDVARAKNRSFCYLMDLLEARSKET
jgi:hypothetical protein